MRPSSWVKRLCHWAAFLWIIFKHCRC